MTAVDLLRGLNGIDMLGMALVFFGVAILWGLMDERARARRARWSANADLRKAADMRQMMNGWNPPEQRNARDRGKVA